jgi:hypothetical protein
LADSRPHLTCTHGRQGLRRMLQLVAFAHAEASFAASCSRKRWLKTRSGMASVPAIQFALAFCRGMIAAERQVADTAHGRIANCIAVRVPSAPPSSPDKQRWFPDLRKSTPFQWLGGTKRSLRSRFLSFAPAERLERPSVSSDKNSVRGSRLSER